MAIPEGFVEFGGHYYKYVKVLVNYYEARRAPPPPAAISPP